MTLIPQHSLGARTAERLKTMIADGLWTGWLPGERSLSHTLQVSHATLRVALGRLRHEGIIEPHHGVGNRIVALPESAGAAGDLPASVGLLVPETVRQLRPFSLWLDDFRDHLIQAGWRLKVYADARHYRANPGKALERLVAQNRHDCWVLVLSSPAMQQWFETGGPPCILAGSCHGGINLPSVDVDHRAVSRHAAGVLLRAGHRHLALFNPSSRHAGDQQTEIGFFEGIRQSPHADSATASVVYHDIDAGSIEKCLQRMFNTRHPQRPTALVISNAYAYLTALSFLAAHGLRVPQDVSLISRDDDPFLDYLRPAPARYLNQPDAFARKLASQVLAAPTRRAGDIRHLRLLPRFFAGRSIAAPPAA